MDKFNYLDDIVIDPNGEVIDWLEGSQSEPYLMTKFKCNGCSRKTEFLWLDQIDLAEGYKAYQCMDCGCVGVKNVAEALDVPDKDISRCDKCGMWKFIAIDCHTCSLIGAK